MTDIAKLIEEGRAKVREIRKILEETKAMMENYERVQLDDLKARFPSVFCEARHVGVGAGWLPIIDETVSRILEIWPQLEINEIREKQAALHIHIGNMPSESVYVDVYKLVGKANMQSLFTCEVCGDEGRVRVPLEGVFRWHACRCEAHTQPYLKHAPLSREYDDLHVWIRGKRYDYDQKTQEFKES